MAQEKRGVQVELWRFEGFRVQGLGGLVPTCQAKSSATLNINMRELDNKSTKSTWASKSR